MGWCIGAALVVFLGSHVALAVALGRRVGFRRGLLAFALPPLAPWWGYFNGLRVWTIIWGASLGLYALGVTVA